MRFESGDGASVDLRLVGYQFPGAVGAPPGDWDANWLVVRGRVRLADGRAWTFTDASLTTWDARDLDGWLRGVVSGHVAPVRQDAPEEDLLAFTEPCLAFSLAARDDSVATVRVHLSLECAPPWLHEAGGDAALFAFFVAVTVPLDGVRRAADDWSAALARFPAR
ncbi:hypothetical protein GXP71_07380 [Cellulomonas sp. H30R-01]|uniref:WapI family immunity protein n=1 Tax=Cellulomonas sp. H30R-01 TaxID=2704467 RepID=UPI00138B8851|nr:hypothetical protein [Cellulomonas sp. H30R-01]QHT55911.1 hypothetical protein GXP71_07380 [Cellulomonas sp. H30R-01]